MPEYVNAFHEIQLNLFGKINSAIIVFVHVRTIHMYVLYVIVSRIDVFWILENPAHIISQNELGTRGTATIQFTQFHYHTFSNVKRILYDKSATLSSIIWYTRKLSEYRLLYNP